MMKKQDKGNCASLFVAPLLLALLVLAATAGPGWADINPTTVQKLVADDGAAEDKFGASLSVDGDTVIIGAPSYNNGGMQGCAANDAGAAYIFTLSIDGSWTQQAKLTAQDFYETDDWNLFGYSVAIDGDTAVIGSPCEENKHGAVYVFVRAGSSWIPQAKLYPELIGCGGFGSSVSIDGDTALIGNIVVGMDATGYIAAYVFTRAPDGTWSEQAMLKIDNHSGLFGHSVSLDSDTALIGVPGDDEKGNYAGSVYVYNRAPDGTWNELTKLTASDGTTYDLFGHSVSLSGNIALIGADQSNDEAGSVYVFTRADDGTWSEQTKLTALDGTAGDSFGQSVSLSGETALIGAYGDDDSGSHSGSAYIFTHAGDGSWNQHIKLTAPDPVSDALFGQAVSLDGETVFIGAGEDNELGTSSGSAYVFTDAIIVDADNICTLSDAITAANTDTATGGCPAGSGHDTIILETDVLLAFGPSARPPITSPITIEGNGHTIDGNDEDGYVLKINNKGTGGDGDLVLNNATITGGNHIHEDGGGPGNGGGLCIAYDGIAELNNVTISGNTAANYGGGIFSCPNCKLTLNNCTISENEADYGGGVHMTLNPPTLTNTLRSSIISGNTAFVLGNEIYASILMGTVTSELNVLGENGEDNGQAFYSFPLGSNDVTATSDGTEPTALADIISPLADNGGSALTHALVTGSPAIDLDATCSTGLTTDQRGYLRPETEGTGCDAGAFEGSVSKVNNTGFLPSIYLLLLNK